VMLVGGNLAVLSTFLQACCGPCMIWRGCRAQDISIRGMVDGGFGFGFIKAGCKARGAVIGWLGGRADRRYDALQQLYLKPLSCVTHRYLAFIGESIMFGAIMAKTLRLWRIFRNPTLQRCGTIRTRAFAVGFVACPPPPARRI
jgi:hypothetical protein